jgi:ADP-dependent NAD(P)H-hydrate dehydratase / NAD(P)H-hydrate epimerase
MGVPEAELIELDADQCARLLPARPADSHKGTYGTLVCVCGSVHYAGAALLCTSAAARGGAGLVALAVPSSLVTVFAGRVREVVTLGLPEEAAGDIDADGSLALIERRSPAAMVVGPGLAESAGYDRLIRALLASDGPPLVLDGGALNLLAAGSEWWTETRRMAIMTPHPGEFGRLTGAAVGRSGDERLDRVREAAARFGQVVVLKGARTVIAGADGRAAISPFANAALASAGTGDVLAGLIGALLAQGSGPFDAACLGVYLHAMAGDRVSRRLGDAGLLASDLPYEIALARHELAQRRATAPQSAP